VNALVIMPAANIDALISVEGTTIYKYQVERLNATSAVVHVPVEERYAPMVFISASAVVNDQMYTESKRITVVPEGKAIIASLFFGNQPGRLKKIVLRQALTFSSFFPKPIP
jgi:hypothetical protein